jgi:hypothetical protein
MQLRWSCLACQRPWVQSPALQRNKHRFLGPASGFPIQSVGAGVVGSQHSGQECLVTFHDTHIIIPTAAFGSPTGPAYWSCLLVPRAQD